ncbi:MAG: hypothetical protein IT363_11100 [Methanoregulaceae archaeon]|nr:hypothetical protein [Methanoregulaceae archaeon]
MKLQSIVAISLLLAMGASAYAQLGNDRSKLPPKPAEKTAARKRVNGAVDKAAELAKTPGMLDEGITALRDALVLSEAFDKRYNSFSPKAASELAKALVRAEKDDEALVAFRKAFRWSPERSDLITGVVSQEDTANYALLLLKAGKVEEAKAMYYYVMRYWGDNGYQYFPYLIVFEPDPTMTVWESTPDKLLSAILMLRAIHSRDHAVRKDRIEEARKRDPSWILPVFYANESFDTKWFTQVAGMASDQHEKEWIFIYQQAFALSGVEQRNAIRDVWLKLGKIAAERRKNSEVLKQAKLDMARLHPKLAAPAPSKVGN